MPIILLSSLSCLSALAYGLHFVHQPVSARRTAVKAIAVGALTALAFAFAAPFSLIGALTLGTLGDVFLSRNGQRNFLAGLVSFLLGHLAYVILLAQMGGAVQGLFTSLWRTIATLVLIAIASTVIRRLLPHLGALRVPVLIYACVILAMGLMALSLPLTWPIILVILGAMAFIASDAILGFELFIFNDTSGNRRGAAMLLWFLYWGGQALTTLGVLLG